MPARNQSRVSLGSICFGKKKIRITAQSPSIWVSLSAEMHQHLGYTQMGCLFVLLLCWSIMVHLLADRLLCQEAIIAPCSLLYLILNNPKHYSTLALFKDIAFWNINLIFKFWSINVKAIVLTRTKIILPKKLQYIYFWIACFMNRHSNFKGSQLRRSNTACYYGWPTEFWHTHDFY